MADTFADAQSAADSSEMKAIKDDIKALRADLAKAVDGARDRTADDAAHGMHKVVEQAIDAAKAADEYRELLETKVRTHPLAALGIALAAGFVLSSMSRR